MKTLSRSFAGGEITPELYGRLDLNKRQTGLALALNMDILPHGPAARSPGHEYVLEAKDSAHNVRLLPFEFSVDQALWLEFGHLYVRFHTPLGTVLETAKAITALTAASPGVFSIAGHGWTTGEWVYLSSIVGPTALNGTFYKVVVIGANTFSLTRLDGTAVSTAALPAYVGSGIAARVYTITTTYASGDLFDLHYTQSNDVFTIVHPSYAAAELRRLGAANWTLTAISFAPGIAAPAGVTVTATVAVATNLTTQRYVVTAVADDGVSESLASTPDDDSNNLTLAGNYNTIAWSAVSGSSRYKVYKQRGGSYGYIGQVPTGTLTLVDDNIEADLTSTPPEDTLTLNTGTGEYPGAVSYHEQRRWFAGTDLKPQGVWATRNGTESNLTSSTPSQDADGLAFKVASRQQNRIRHLVPLGDLATLTNAAEWRIFADGAPAITPSTLSTKAAGYAGASNVQPAVTSGSVLYVQGQGSFVRELSYGGAEANYNYRTIDLSVMAPHLFTGYTIVDLAFSRAPDPRLWCVRSDGVLLGMTYVPEQQVYAWHRHTTAGAFKSAAVIVSANEDVLAVVVERVVNGRTVKYIEKRRKRAYTGAAAAFFVDAGVTYSGAAAVNVTNLWHLEGREVDIFADGAVETRQTVANGTLPADLPVASTMITIGLPYVSRIKMLPLALEGAEAGGQGTQKNVNEVFLRVYNSLAVKAGPTFDQLREYPGRDVTDAYDTPPADVVGEINFTIDGVWSADGAVCIEQDLPLPLTVASVTLDVEVGG